MADQEEPILQFFAYDHLREDLKDISAPFGQLAQDIVKSLPRNAERSVALRKFLRPRTRRCAPRIYGADAALDPRTWKAWRKVHQPFELTGGRTRWRTGISSDTG